jgi:hypothetical protein
MKTYAMVHFNDPQTTVIKDVSATSNVHYQYGCHKIQYGGRQT